MFTNCATTFSTLNWLPSRCWFSLLFKTSFERVKQHSTYVHQSIGLTAKLYRTVRSITLTSMCGVNSITRINWSMTLCSTRAFCNKIFDTRDMPVREVHETDHPGHHWLTNQCIGHRIRERERAELGETTVGTVSTDEVTVREYCLDTICSDSSRLHRPVQSPRSVRWIGVSPNWIGASLRFERCQSIRQHNAVVFWSVHPRPRERRLLARESPRPILRNCESRSMKNRDDSEGWGHAWSQERRSFKEQTQRERTIERRKRPRSSLFKWKLQVTTEH